MLLTSSVVSLTLFCAPFDRNNLFTEAAMGIQVNALSQDRSKYVDAVYNVCADVIYRTGRIWLSVDFIYYKTARGKKFLNSISVLHDTADKVITEKRQRLEQNGDNVMENDLGTKKRKAFLDFLLELSIDDATLTQEQIRDEVDTFMFAVRYNHKIAAKSVAFMRGSLTPFYHNPKYTSHPSIHILSRRYTQIIKMTNNTPSK